MDAKGRKGFTSLNVYRLAEELADSVWDLVLGWSILAQDTVGKQMIRAADSIGANIAEGAGRGTYKDNRHFVNVARGSLNETIHWLRRAYRRHLLRADEVKRLRSLLDELAPRLNAYRNPLTRASQLTKKSKTTNGSQRPSVTR